MLDIDTYRLRARGVYSESSLSKRFIVLRMYDEFLRERGLEPGVESLNLWVDELIKRGISGRSVNTYVHYVLSYFYLMMVDVDERKLRMLRMRLPRVSVRRVDYLSDEEVASLIKNTVSPVRKLIYSIMYTYCRRLGEVLLLTWKDVDLVNNRITFRILKKKVEERATFELEPWIRSMILEYKDYLGKVRLFEITARAVEKAFKRDCERAGIKARGRWLRVHMLRHSRITSLRDKGVPLDVISKYLARHSRYDTTVQYYRAVSEEEKVSIPRAGDILGVG
ncbi:MAG: site-specific integrase [Thermoproteota archaeon]